VYPTVPASLSNRMRLSCSATLANVTGSPLNANRALPSDAHMHPHVGCRGKPRAVSPDGVLAPREASQIERHDPEWNVRWLRTIRRIPKPDGTLRVSTQHAIANLGFLQCEAETFTRRSSGVRLPSGSFQTATNFTPEIAFPRYA
jgi:hypothetical protein